MNKQIDLLKKEEGISEDLKVISSKFKIVSLVVLFLTISIEVVLLFFSIGLTNKEKSVITKIKTAEELVSSYKEAESLNKIYKQRLTSLHSILKTEFSYPRLLADISGLMPEGLYLTDLSAVSDGSLVISGVGNTSMDLGAFITNLTNPENGEKLFSEATLGSVIGNSDGSYRFSMSLKYRSPTYRYEQK